MNTDDRRLLLAFVLSLGVFILYQIYLTRAYPPPRGLNTDGGVTRAVNADTGARAAAPVQAAPVLPPVSQEFPALGDLEETAVLRGGDLEITTTSRGAGIRQIRLLGIPRLPHRDTRDVILVDDARPEPSGGVRLPGQSSVSVFKKVAGTPDAAHYGIDIPAGRPLLRYERTIRLSEKRYEIILETKIRNLSGQSVQLGSDSSSALGVTLASFPPKASKTDLDIHEVFVKLGKDVEHRQEEMPGFFDGLFGRKKVASSIQHETLDGMLRWVSLGDRYFTVTLVPGTPMSRVLMSMEGPMISAVAQYGSFPLMPGEEKVFEERLYAGPKVPAYLRQYGEDLLDVMNFGWFDWLGFWMLRLMNLFYRGVPNYGVSILLLTCVVRVVLYPLTYKSYVSMAKLKELAPKMKAIQDKYKDNREKLNKELMKMYKDNKVNPAGGCLPILLQIPVFIAFYRMLQYSIELRGGSFLWVTDLSEKDPYYILPVLMGVSMLIQQKMTPTPDPNQAKIGMFMTVLFTFMFLAFPAGLNLYWFVSTVLGIWQQKVIERKLKAAVSVQPSA